MDAFATDWYMGTELYIQYESQFKEPNQIYMDEGSGFIEHTGEDKESVQNYIRNRLPASPEHLMLDRG